MDVRTRIGFWALIVAALVCGLIPFAATSATKDEARIERTGTRIEARVVDIQRFGAPGVTVQPTWVAYLELPSGVAVDNRFGLNGEPSTLKIGQTVTVAYDPNGGSEDAVLIHPEASRNKEGNLVWVIAGFLAMSAFCLYTAWKVRRQALRL